jgi:hypothetical protein
MSTFAITFTVSGNGEFPMDMLRYDHVAPWDSSDAAMIYNSFYAHRNDTLVYERPVIKLTRYSERRLWQPTIARWASFGWVVADIESVKVPT